VRRQFEVNLFGTMNVARAVAPHMRARRSGLIVTISSVSGLVSNGGGAVYSASKFAVEGWMEGFAQELAPFGVRSLLVEPGMLRTDFMDGKSASFGSIDIGNGARRRVRQCRPSGDRGGRPRAVQEVNWGLRRVNAAINSPAHGAHERRGRFP